MKRNLRDGDKIFLPFDFQDEYIGGLLLTKSNLDFKIKVVYSDKVHSYEVNKSIFGCSAMEKPYAWDMR